MRNIILIVAITLCNNSNAQHRVNKLSANILSNFYSYGEGQGSLNNVVRFSEGLSFAYKTYDSIKAKGMIYEFLSNTTTAYYKNILSGGSVLEVSDLHTNFNFIMPILILHNKRMEHCIGFGLSVGILSNRDYFDENNISLPYNSTTLQKIRFGKYWTTAFMFDYQFDMKFSKHLGFNMGMRYTTSSPVHSGNANYIITQGNGLSFKYGVFYQFK